MDMEKRLYVTASEIGEYVYCQRAWWLRVQGLLSQNQAMRDGVIKHTRLSQWLKAYKSLLALAIAMIIGGIILAIISLIFFVQH
jgi:CRISPR/Cas system-associated exonuclease Cas4 (RecB family)